MRAVARHRRRALLRRLGPAGRLLVGRMVLWHLACTSGFPIIFVLFFCSLTRAVLAASCAETTHFLVPCICMVEGGRFLKRA